MDKERDWLFLFKFLRHSIAVLAVAVAMRNAVVLSITSICRLCCARGIAAILNGLRGDHAVAAALVSSATIVNVGLRRREKKKLTYIFSL
jgi:hypothetical protein